LMNGVSVSNISYIPSGNNETFLRVLKEDINEGVKNQDDTHQLIFDYTSAASLSFTAYSKFDDINVGFTGFYSYGVTASAVVGDTTVLSNTETGCLTVEQVGKILNKIESICGCELNSMSSLVGTDTTINIVGDECNC